MKPDEPTDGNDARRMFPSLPAAIVTGVLVMPLFMRGWKYIEATFHSQALVILWFALGFFAPVLLSTSELKYAAHRRRELGGFFRPLTSPDDFRRYYIPTWKRLFALFVSTAASTLLLKAIGVEL